MKRKDTNLIEECNEQKDKLMRYARKTLSYLVYKMNEDKPAKTFIYKGEKYKLFEHIVNCGRCEGRMTERAIELSIAKKWLKSHDNVIEIGAVTPYYWPRVVKEIVDPMDPHKLVNKKDSVFNIDLQDRNILSISTIEHIGTGDYGFDEDNTSVNALCKILEESRSCLVTFPIGYNKLLDDWIRKNENSEILTVFIRGEWDNKWKEYSAKGIFEKNIKINYGGVKAIAVIVK